MDKADANAMWGELREGLHHAGYGFERAMARLKTMLKDGAWKVGGRFRNHNEFLDSLCFESLKIAAEERKEIAKLIKALEPKISNRQIAKATGTPRATVNRAVGSSEPSKRRNANQNKGRGGSGEPVGFSGAQAAKLVERKETGTEHKQVRRDERERELGLFQQALPNKKYGVIVADPEWRFEPWSRETGMDRAADNHYPTSCTEVIAARDVPSIAADDCVLFLWATVPMLPHALMVMAAWGFDYRTHFVWVKDRVGTGYWNRNKHELLLVGARGNIPAPAMGSQWPSVVSAKVGKHSAKPNNFLLMIEEYFPTIPKIELNRRGPPLPGWDAWGFEVQRVAAE